MCLKDFEDFYEAHKEVPENQDQIFVMDVNTKTFKEAGEIVTLFRKFFTTKRLLGFTQHVSEK